VEGNNPRENPYYITVKFPQRSQFGSCTDMGTGWANWFGLRLHNNLTKGTSKNVDEVWEMKTSVGWTSNGNPHNG